MNITGCGSELCPYRDTCYRYKLKQNSNEQYVDFSYDCNEYTGFDSYISITRE